MTTRLPDTLRTELADGVERILGLDLDLQALAQEMDDATGAIRTRSWIRAQPATVDQVLEINRTLLPVTEHELSSCRAAPSSRTPHTAPPSSTTAASCCARRRTGTGSGSATDR